MNLRIYHRLWFVTFCYCILSFANNTAFAKIRTVEEVSAVHKILQEALLNAAKGDTLPKDKIEAKVDQAVAAQIDQFVKQCNMKGDSESIALAAAVKADENIREQLKLLLLSELTHQEIPRMEYRGIRDTLDVLDIHIASNYAIVVGALPENQGVVRIRLPDFHSCPGCKRILEKALNDTAGIAQAVVDTKTNTAQMVVDLDLDIVEKLDEIKLNTVQLAGWKLIRKE